MLPESSFSSEKPCERFGIRGHLFDDRRIFGRLRDDSVPGDRNQDGTARTLLFQRIGVGIGALPQDSETASIETEYEQAHRVVFRIPEADAEHGRRTDESLQKFSFHDSVCFPKALVPVGVSGTETCGRAI